MPRNLPFLVDATVVQQDPDNYRIYVSIDAFGGQIPFLPIDVITHGPRDAVRGTYPPLPTPGTRGLVAFTRGDDRTGRWIGAQSPALPDSSALSPSAGNARYTAEYAGLWHWTGSDGTMATGLPDGSTIMVAPSGAVMPAPTRHTVNAKGERVRTPFTAAQRNPNGGANAYGVSVTLNNGASFSASAAGAVSMTAAAGQPVTVKVASGASITLNADGSVTLTPSGHPVTVQGDLTVTGNLTAGAGAGTGDLHVAGDVISHYGTGTSVGLRSHGHPALNSPPNVPS